MKLNLSITLFSFLIAQLCTAQIGFQQNTIINQSFGIEDPNAAVTADVDGDGFEDIIVSGWNRVVWYKGIDGLGNFSATNSTVYLDDYGLEQVNVADLDGDNDIDIIFFLDQGSGMQIVWCENTDGMGTFSEPEELIFLENWLHLRFQIADIDGDTDMDIGFGNSSYIGWLENDGQATFTTIPFLGTNSTTGNNYDSFFLIDIDNDNRLDLITDYGYDLRAFKHENNGSITLLETMSTFSQGSFIDGGDIDNDGDNDIVFIFENGNADRKVIWYQNMDGQGTFSNDEMMIPLPNLDANFNSDAKSLSLNDMDNDGKIDVVFLEARTEKISFYKNLGHGIFYSEVVVAENLGNELVDISVKDIDGDDALDVVYTAGPAKVSWFKNIDGLGDFGDENAVSTYAYSLNHVVAGDIDGDGDLDVVSSSNNDHKLAWYKNTNGLGDFTEKQMIISDTVYVVMQAMVLDVDGDNDTDILALSLLNEFGGGYQIFWLENDGTGNFITEHTIESTPNQILNLAYADIDGDNDMDVISAEDNSVLALYKNNGDGTFQPQIVFSEEGTEYPLSLQVADIDGDNDVDVLASYNNSEIMWHENIDGLGDLTTKHVIVDQMHYPIAIFAADIDGDNDKDVLFANRFHDEVGYFINTDGLGTFGPKVITSEFPQNPRTMYAIDLDNDGDNDMLTDMDQPDSKLLWYENDGSANFGEAIVITDNIEFISHVTSADFNSDGKNDLMTASFGDNQIAWYENLGSFLNTISGVVLLDLDENGCTDQDLVLPYLLMTTTNGNNSFSIFTQADGSYTFQANEASFETTITSALPTYYTSNPLSQTSDFTGQTGVIDTSDFCIEANQVINDLTISVYPSSNDPRPGFDIEYQLVYRNQGTTILNGSVVFEFDDTKMQFLNASETVASQTANTITFDFVGLNPFEIRTIELEFNVFAPPISNIDDVLSFMATVTPITGDHTPSDNVFNFDQTLIGSYDPNDITVLEGDEILLEEANKYLHYVIRFQNTGTASAINVTIENVLDDKLDWTTMQLEHLSHTGRVEIMDGNLVKFIFNDINLPDSTSNETNSHGFIAYKIKPKSDVVIGDIFKNTADIFFDFNPPITTNTASTEIVMMTNTVDGFDPMRFSIFPNPAHEKLTITSKLPIEKLSIFDAYGRLVKSENFLNSPITCTLDLSNFSSGVYFVEIQSGTLKQTQKFMIYP